MSDERVDCVRALLQRSGHEQVGVSVAGQGNDIAVLHCASELASELRSLSALVRGCGFRYVTIDLDDAENGHA